MGGHSSGGLFPGTSGERATSDQAAHEGLSDSGRALVAEAQSKGVKISPEKVVGIAKDPNGKIVWIETGHGGDKGSGLAHIIEDHGKQFNRKGVSNTELPRYLLQAVCTGKVVGRQGTRKVYEFNYNGSRHRVAITVSNNGYIVGANPRSFPKEN